MEMNKETLRMAVHYLFVLATVIMVVSGFGISNDQQITPWTAGILNKEESFDLHMLLVWPFVVLLVLHVYLVITIRMEREAARKAQTKK